MNLPLAFCFREMKVVSLRATFPAMVIRQGDHLHLTTACANDTPQCDLTFKVTALTEAGNYILVNGMRYQMGYAIH